MKNNTNHMDKNAVTLANPFIYLWFLAILAFPLFGGLNPSLQRMQIEPIDFKWDDGLDNFPTSLAQIETGGEHIYIRGMKDAFVTELHPSGHIVRTIGTKGSGPGEISHSILAMAYWRGHLWMVDTGRPDHMLHYHNGDYQGSFLVPSSKVQFHGFNSNVFAASNNKVVFPASPRTKSMASAISFQGEVTGQIGDLLFDRDVQLLRMVPEINDTNWVHDGDRWYALYSYFPLIRVFDDDFQLKGEISVETPRIIELRDKILDFQPQKKFSRAVPLFSDFKIWEGSLYLMCSGRLLEVDAKSGDLRGVYSFFGKGDDFAYTEGEDLNLPYFSILNNGDLILGHPAFMWNHDLWRVGGFKPPANKTLTTWEKGGK